MLYSVVITNKVVNEAKSKRKPCLIFKVNFRIEKPTIRQGELSYYMMNKMSFCSKWIGSIKSYIESSTVPVLIKWKFDRGV